MKTLSDLPCVQIRGSGATIPVRFIGDTSAVIIYKISERPRTRAVYIGSTSQTLRARLRAHLSDAFNGSDLPFHVWLRDHQNGICVEVLEHATGNNRHEREKHWISKFDRLLNLTDGGAGLSGHKFAGSEHARKISKALKTGQNWKCLNCGSEFWRKRKDATRGHNKFCSRECYQSWQCGRPKLKHCEALPCQ